MKIFICAGEPSGDMHAAVLMQELRSLKGDIQFLGIGGKCMQQSDFDSIIPIEQISVVGFSEVIKRIGLFFKLKKQCEKIMLSEKVDCFIAIDYPGFNLKLAKFANKNNIPVYYYIAPQVWAWGSNRWKQLKNRITELFVVFPFEEKYFKNKNINATFVGHPLLNNPIFSKENILANENNRIENLVALFPGSRKHEIIKNLLIFKQTAEIITQKNKNIKFGIAVPNNIDNNIYHNLLNDCEFNYELYHNNYELMLKAKVGLVKIGTTTLEATLLNMNMISTYNTTFTHYWMGKLMIKLKYIALPNILAEKEIVPEYIQNKAKPIILANEILEYLNNPSKCNVQKIEYNKIRKILMDSKHCDLADKILAYLIENSNKKSFEINLT